MNVKDVYHAVCLAAPDIETVRFFAYLREGLLSLRNLYDNVEYEQDLRYYEDEIGINPYYLDAIAAYILMKNASDADFYNKYKTEFYELGRAANLKIIRERKPGRLYAPEFR